MPGRIPVVALGRIGTVVGVLLLFGGLFRLPDGGFEAADQLSRVLLVAGWGTIGVADGLYALHERELTMAVLSPFFLLLAAVTAFGGSEDPVWFTVVGVGFLFLFLAGGVPVGVHVWRREQDERQRLVLSWSMAVGFLAIMILVFAFELLGQFGAAPHLTSSWMLLAGTGSWLVAWFVLRWRT